MTFQQLFLKALFITETTEILVVILLIKYLFKNKGIKTSTIVTVSFIASALTLPYLWFVLPSFIFDQNIYIWVGEFLVFVIEALIYNQVLKLKPWEAIMISLLANLSSIITGKLFL